MEPNEIRLWKAAFAIRNALNSKTDLAFFVQSEALNDLARRKPDSYLSELAFWRDALRNQNFFKVEGSQVCVSCMAKREDGTLSTLCFICFYDKAKLVITGVEESGSKSLAGNWIGIKSETRKARGY